MPVDLNPDIEPDVSADKGVNVAPARRRWRKPRIDKLIAQAERAGKNVTSITTPEGITLNFGELIADQTCDLDKWMAKRRAS